MQPVPDALSDAPEELDTRMEYVLATYRSGDIVTARGASYWLEGRAVDEASWRKLHRLFCTVADNARAERAALQFLTVSPGHAGASIELIKLLTRVKRHEEVHERIDSLLRVPSLDALVLFEIAQCQIALSRYDDAASTARRGIGLDGGSFQLWGTLVQALHHAGNNRAVRRHLGRLTALAGENARNWAFVAEAASWSRQCKLARMAIDKVFAVSPVPEALRLTVARAQLSIGAPSEAWATLADIDVAVSTDSVLLKKIVDLIVGTIENGSASAPSLEFATSVSERWGRLTASPSLHEVNVSLFRMSLVPADLIKPPRKATTGPAKFLSLIAARSRAIIR